MKIFTRISICLLAFALLTHCQPTTETTEVATNIKVSGQIENAKGKTIYMMTPFGQEEVKVVDGSFSAEIPATEPIIISAFFNRNSWIAYATPGEEIKISFDEEQFDSTFNMESSFVQENEFFQGLSKSLREEMGNTWDIYALDEADMLSKMDSIQNNSMEMLEAFKGDYAEATPDFVAAIQDHIRYTAGRVMAFYPRYHTYAVPADSNFEAGDKLNAALMELEKEDPSLIRIPDYVEILRSKKQRIAKEIMDADSTYKDMENGYMKASVAAIESGFENPEIKEYLIYDQMNQYLAFEGVSAIEEDYQNFMADAKSEVLKQKLSASYQTWAHLREGMEAPDFNYPDLDSVFHKLSDYQGKYVYIDVWATWCGPCIAEQPYLEKIEEEYKDNEDIVFMGVSIDADKDAWGKYVVEKEMKGVQLIADGAWDADINQSYNIKGIPRFILVDTEGNLINANAPRPSSDALAKKLKELLTVEPVTG